ncbi:MAG: WecB/TagA/CpsF family glycosyltransferase [Clostridia bacterium]|nr:WecB/TagA/CpsF family glycosyltransferase [Clostridia bacterium]
MNTIDILGVRFTPIDTKTAYEEIAELLSKQENARIFTPNAEILYKASRERELVDLLNSADMLLPDGVGTVLASRLSDKPLPCRITGIDTAEYVLSLAARSGLSVFLLGGERDVAEKAKGELERRIQGLRICGTHHGYFERSGKENEAVVKMIADAHPDVLFVCLGFPEQEKWIAKNTPSLPFLRLSMGLGGSFDVWSGKVRRAPEAVRRMGLEWLARSLGDMRRLRRLPYLFLFILKAARYRNAISSKTL